MVCRSLPQMVAISVSTSTSPSRRSGSLGVSIVNRALVPDQIAAVPTRVTSRVGACTGSLIVVLQIDQRRIREAISALATHAPATIGNTRLVLPVWSITDPITAPLMLASAKAKKLTTPVAVRASRCPARSGQRDQNEDCGP